MTATNLDKTDWWKDIKFFLLSLNINFKIKNYEKITFRAYALSWVNGI